MGAMMAKAQADQGVDTLIFIITTSAIGYLVYILEQKIRRKEPNDLIEPTTSTNNRLSTEDRRAINREELERRNRERILQTIREKDDKRVRRGPRGGRYTITRTRSGRPYRRYF